MERKTSSIEKAKEIMGQNFIGPEEFLKISKKFSILPVLKNIGDIPFDEEFLKELRKDYILIFGTSKDDQKKPLTINKMRDFFGTDPEKFEPCFYNQDWYLKEKFSFEKTLGNKWYLIKKTIDKKTAGKNPEEIKNMLKKGEFFPSAVLAVFTFFAYYSLCGEFLWKESFIWCGDKDTNGDRIYVGRYSDPNKINKNGFNIHRHLSIKPFYGLAPEIKNLP